MPICRWPTHRAPAVEVAADHADVERGGLAGGEPAGVGAGLEHQVVHVLVVGVAQLDHEPVAGRHLDPSRVKRMSGGLDPHRWSSPVGGTPAAAAAAAGPPASAAGSTRDPDAPPRAPPPPARSPPGRRTWPAGRRSRERRVRGASSGYRPAAAPGARRRIASDQQRQEAAQRPARGPSIDAATLAGTGSAHDQQPGVDEHDPQGSARGRARVLARAHRAGPPPSATGTR